jgi:hypothetical protein
MYKNSQDPSPASDSQNIILHAMPSKNAVWATAH